MKLAYPKWYLQKQWNYCITLGKAFQSRFIMIILNVTLVYGFLKFVGLSFSAVGLGKF